MNKIDNWIENYVNNQLTSIKYETNWLNGYITCSTNSNVAVVYQPNGYYDVSADYNRTIDKDEKIRNLEARVKELEAILEEEI